MGNQTSRVMKIEVNNNFLILSTENEDFLTSAKEQISCETSGNTMYIGIKGNVLEDVLSNVSSSQVILRMTEPSRPIMVFPDENREGETFLGLLMPCLVQG